MKKQKRIIRALVVMLMISLLMPTALAEETIRIGGIGVLSGPAAVYGQAVKEGVDLYISQLNEKGGLLGKKVEVIWEDSQGDQTVAVNAYNKLVDNDQVVAILGPVLTDMTKVVAQNAADIGIPLITASATAYDITTDRPSVFRTCFLDPFQATIMAKYAKEAGYKTAASIYDNGDEYSTGLFNAFKAEAEAQGLQLVAVANASGNDVDFKAQLTNLKAASPDCVFLPYYGAPSALILTQANEIGLNTKFLGADGISNIVAAITDKKLLTNIVYSDHFTTDADSTKAVEYVKAFEAKYGRTPDISFAATAYDAAMVLCEAIEKAGTTDYAKVVEAIKNTKADGVTGTITFDDHNDPIKSAFLLSFNDQGDKVFVGQINP